MRRLGARRCRGWPRRSCRPCAKNTLTSPVAHRPDRVDGVEAVLARRLEAELVAAARRGRRRRPSPRCPWCGRPARWSGRAPGTAPAPGLPMLPRSSSRLTISWMVATALLVLGQAHRPADDDAVGLAVALRERARSPRRVSPVAASTSSQVEPVEVARRTRRTPRCARRRTPRRPRPASIGQLRRAPRTAPGRRRAGPGGSRRRGRCPWPGPSGRLRVLEPRAARPRGAG